MNRPGNPRIPGAAHSLWQGEENGLASALVMVLMARARGEGWAVEVMHLECGRARLVLPVGGRMTYRPVLQRLARWWPFERLDVDGAYSVQAVAVIDRLPHSLVCAGPPVGMCTAISAVPITFLPPPREGDYAGRLSMRPRVIIWQAGVFAELIAMTCVWHG